MAKIFEFLWKDGNITPEKARKLRQMQFRDKTAYVWGLRYRWDPSLSRNPVPWFPHFMPPWTGVENFHFAFDFILAVENLIFFILTIITNIFHCDSGVHYNLKHKYTGEKSIATQRSIAAFEWEMNIKMQYTAENKRKVLSLCKLNLSKLTIVISVG